MGLTQRHVFSLEQIQRIKPTDMSSHFRVPKVKDLLAGGALESVLSRRVGEYGLWLRE
jgi:hypothetical protein